MKRLAFLIFNNSPSGLIRAQVYNTHFKMSSSFDVKYFHLYSEICTDLLKYRYASFYPFRILVLGLNKISILFKQLNFLFLRKNYDKIIVIKYISPEYLLRIKKKYYGKIYYDIDDALWLDEYLGEGRFIQIVSNVDKVLCDNNFLKNFSMNFNNNCAVVPGTSQIEKFKNVHRTRIDHEIVQIIWVGSSSTIYYMNQLINVLNRIGKKYKNVQLILLGVGATDNGFPTNIYIPTKYVKNYDNDKMINCIINADIGLFPLLNNANSLGRGILKLQLYLAGEIATITSSIKGEAENIIVNGENGFLANNEDDWYYNLSLLIEDAELRKNMGREGRKTVFQKYSTTECFKILLKEIDQ
jgi:glycosyltransferase involved in cell wall biosynthesis